MDGGINLETLTRHAPQPQNAPTAPPNPSPGAPGLASLVKQPGPAQSAARPQPTLDQTMAGMHYFDALMKEMKPIMADPQFGKASVKSKVMDGIANLIGSQILSLPQAMDMIKGFPSDPQEQKRVMMTTMKQLGMAKEMMFEHWRSQGQMEGDPMQDMKWGPENHGEHMTALMGHYKR